MKDYRISLLRFLAIILVVTCRIFQQLEIPLSGWLNIGVQIFLSISGYLFGMRVISESAYCWFKRRFLRIYIPYALMLILSLGCFALIAPDLIDEKFLYSFLCLQAFLGAPDNLGHLWYVSIILVCYAITPALSKVAQSAKSLWKTCAATICLSVLCVVVAAVTGCGYLAWVANYILAFFYASAGRNISKGKTVVILFFGLLFAVISSLGAGGLFSLFNKLGHILLGFGITFIFLPSRGDSLFKNKWTRCILDWNDKYSYAIYLVHAPFFLGSLALIQLNMDFGDIVARTVVLVILVVILAFLLQKCADVLLGFIKSRKSNIS